MHRKIFLTSKEVAVFGGPFNWLSFIHSLTVEINFSVSFESSTAFDSLLNLEMPMSASFEVETELAMFESSMELVTKMIREKSFKAGFEAKRNLTPSSDYSMLMKSSSWVNLSPGIKSPSTVRSIKLPETAKVSSISTREIFLI